MKIPPLGVWPMSHLVMGHGIVLSLATGAKYLLAAGFVPSEGWLIYLTASLSLTFGVKRITHKPDLPVTAKP